MVGHFTSSSLVESILQLCTKLQPPTECCRISLSSMRSSRILGYLHAPGNPVNSSKRVAQSSILRAWACQGSVPSTVTSNKHPQSLKTTTLSDLARCISLTLHGVSPAYSASSKVSSTLSRPRRSIYSALAIKPSYWRRCRKRTCPNNLGEPVTVGEVAR